MEVKKKTNKENNLLVQWHPMLIKLSVLFLLSAFWLLFTVNSAIDELSIYDRFYIAVIVGGGWLIQLTVLLIVMRFVALCQNFALAVFAVTNLFSLYLCFVKGFFTLTTVSQLLLILLALFIAHQFFTSLSTDRRWQYTVVSISALLLIVQTNVLYQHLSRYGSQENAEQNGNSTVSGNINIVDFINTPNVYLISFDSALPEALAKEYYQIDELAYHTMLEENDFHIFRNAFTDGPSTKAALNRLLAMDPEYYNRLAKENKEHDLFTGLAPAPLLQVFKANDYITSTYSRDNYFGAIGGTHVDNYNVPFLFSFCKNHPVFEMRTFGFFGYCLYMDSDFGKQKIKVESHRYYDNISVYADFVLEDILGKLQSGQPLFSMIHFITPDHTPMEYDGSQEHFLRFKKDFLDHSINKTVPLMQRILKFMRENDPNAYLYFYSDHGSFLSRSLNESENENLDEKSQNFYIQDRYAIFSAFYPSSACQTYFEQTPGAPHYVTNSSVIRALLRCLADGADAANSDIQYRLWPEQYGWWGEKPAFYEDYLYE